MLTNFGFIQIWECAHKWFIVESVHERLLDICHLRSLGTTCLEHVFVVVDIYVQMIPN